ncbi:tetratricopeptide repeat protein [Chloroflexi bacterium TSY]|nr:tetratricopeptide repeat protein [Chloroflexi bacterium TSY]
MNHPRKLSVFRGSFQREAAEAVAGASLMLLANLVDKSLLQRVSVERYEVHELLRQYAAEQLAESPDERDHTLDRHMQYYSGFLKNRIRDLRWQRQREALNEISADGENIRACWRRAVAAENWLVIEAAQEAWLLYCEMRGRFREGEEAFHSAITKLLRDPDGLMTLTATETLRHNPAVENLSSEQIRLLAQLCCAQGILKMRLGDFEYSVKLMNRSTDHFREMVPPAQQNLAFSLMWQGLIHISHNAERAQELLMESSALFAELNEKWGVGCCLTFMGVVDDYHGQYDAAEQNHQQAIQIYRQLGEERSLGFSLISLARVAIWTGDYPRAEKLLTEALENRQQFRDRLGLAMTLAALADLARYRGEYADARRLAQESLALMKEIGDQRGTAGSLGNLGSVARVLGEYRQAEYIHRQSLSINRKIGFKIGIAPCLRDLGRVAFHRGNHEQAYELLEESMMLYEEGQNESGIVLCECLLGHVAIAMGGAYYKMAQEHFTNSITQGLTRSLLPIMLDAFSGLAYLRYLRDATFDTYTLAVMTFIMQHPATIFETKERIQKERAEITQGMTSEEIDKAQVQGQLLNLESIQQNVLGEVDQTVN